jgi:hypothetical protein
MQKHIHFFIACFLSVSLFSCSETETTKPILTVNSPVAGAYYLTGDSINFEALFSDNDVLNQYRVEIKNNFGGQETALAPWQPIFVYNLEGSEEAVQNYFYIPDTIPSGWYLVIAKTVDAEGNEAVPDTTPVFIQNAIDAVVPVIDISSPADSAIIIADSLIISALISDNLELFKFYVNVSNESSTIQLHSETKKYPDNPYNFQLVLHGADTLAGWFKLSISAIDSMNNAAYTERKFLIQ